MSDELPNGWGPSLADLAERRAVARAMGGPEKLASHHGRGKLDARSRLEVLFDPGTFTEFGTLVGNVPADGFVCGHGLVDGRPVMAGAEDFTVLGGSIGPGAANKRYRLGELALQERAPLVMLLEGAGHRPPMKGESHGRAPTDLLIQAQLSGKVPVVTGVLGASAGHGALIAPMSDFAIMSLQGAIFTAGPPVVKEALGEEVTKEELGGPAVAIGSGLIHNVAADDVAVLQEIRTYLSYFPSSAWSYPPSAPTADNGPRLLDEILELIPRDNASLYDVRPVVSLLVDGGRFFQIQPDFGPAIVCALAHLGGEPVAIVANQPQVIAGSIDSDAADKAAHFIQVADSFHLPLILLADNPGVLAGTVSERAAILRAGARMFAAQTQARTIKLQVTMRKAYGFGSMVMGMVGFDHQTSTFAFPGATMGAMGAKGSSAAVGADAERAAEIRTAELQASYNSARTLGFDEMIDPRELRNALLRSLRLGLNRRQSAAEPTARFAISP